MAIRTDASGDFLNISSVTGLTQATVMAWVKLSVDTNIDGTFFSFNGTGQFLGVDSTGTKLVIWNSSTGTFGTDLTVGTWYHVAFTNDNTDLRGYLNGVLDMGPVTRNAISIDTLRFMQDGFGQWVNGCICAAK